MVKHTLKILWCEHRKIFEVCLAIFQHYEWKGWVNLSFFLPFFFKKKTRGAFPAAKIRKEGFWKVFNVWNKSLFSNFEVGWRMFPWSRKCLSVVLKQIQIINGSVKAKKSCASRNFFDMEFKFSKLFKSIVFRCLRANKTVGCSEYALRNRRNLSKKMKKIFG